MHHDLFQPLRDFYSRFGCRDSARMGASYADDAASSDPVFPGLDAAGATGRPVRNQVESRFEFRDGPIVKQAGFLTIVCPEA